MAYHLCRQHSSSYTTCPAQLWHRRRCRAHTIVDVNCPGGEPITLGEQLEDDCQPLAYCPVSTRNTNLGKLTLLLGFRWALVQVDIS